MIIYLKKLGTNKTHKKNYISNWKQKQFKYLGWS